VRRCLPQLSESQRQVVLLRDVEGVEPAAVCELLRISDGNQRVLLHRGRTHVRRLLAEDMGKT
jgi:RNA polymerase sigma-70 factor (ECF subfamily)